MNMISFILLIMWKILTTIQFLLLAESVQALDIQEGDVFFALATFVSETGEAMNLVEGEKVHVLEWNNADWWYVRKHLTEESGWVPAQYLKDEQTYTMYVQKKLLEKIEKLPVFDSKLISFAYPHFCYACICTNLFLFL